MPNHRLTEFLSRLVRREDLNRDEAGQLLDALLDPGMFANWQAGQQFDTPFPLQLPADLPPGEYRIVMGVYAPSGARLPLRARPLADADRGRHVPERRPVRRRPPAQRRDPVARAGGLARRPGESTSAWHTCKKADSAGAGGSATPP